MLPLGKASELANYNANFTYADEPKAEWRGQTIPVGQFPLSCFWVIRYAWKCMGMVPR